MIEIIERSHDAVIVATLVGRLDVTSAASAAKTLSEIVGKRVPLLLDLSQLTYISSAGLRVILKVAKEARETGHGFALAAPQPNVREVLEISGFPSMVALHDGQAEALAALRRDL